jgi:uncharacterized damage-inducible protein DinB
VEIIEQLEKTKSETLKYFDLADEDLQKSYGPGKWSVRYVLHHLADAETIYFYRVRQVISEPKQVIWVIDENAWAEKLDYSTVPLELARSIYLSSREGVIYYARQHYEKSDELKFVHTEAGIRTLKEQFDSVVTHNRQHVGNIEQALRYQQKRQGQAP